MANDESPSAKKEPPWLSILPPMPRISVSTTSRARLSHRRPVLLSPQTPLPSPPSAPVAVVDRSPPSSLFPKYTHKSSRSPISETFPALSPSPLPPQVAVVAPSPPSPFSSKSAHKFSESQVLETLSAPIPSPPSSASPTRTAAAAASVGEGSWPACSSSAAGQDCGDTAAPSCVTAVRAVHVGSLGSMDSSGNSSSLCAASKCLTFSSSEEIISDSSSRPRLSFPTAGIPSLSSLQQASSSEGGHLGVQKDGVGLGMDSIDGVKEAYDPDIGGLSRDGCTSSGTEFAVAEATSFAGCLDELEEVHEYVGAGIRLNGENCPNDACREAETTELVRREEVFQDEVELGERQQLMDGGNEAKDPDFSRSRKDDCTPSGMEVTIAESTSAAICHIAFKEVDGCKGVGILATYENCSDIGRQGEISGLVNKEELVLYECELEEGQLPGEWSGCEDSHEESEPAQMLEDSAAVCPVGRGVPTVPMTLSVANQIYYPFQVEGIHSEQRSGGNSKAKGKKKKKHKKGEGSKKRSREKSNEKHKEILKKRVGEGKGVDLGSNLDGVRSSEESTGRGDQIGKNNGTGKFKKVPDTVSQTLPKKATVDEGPEDGEILLESTKTNDGILSSLVEAEVGLWTTDDVDDQLVAEMEQDGALKRKRGPETAERKLKRKIAKRKRRAQKEREQGIRRPPRTVQSKPVKVLCTHYMKGRCAKGDQCTFSHDAVPLTKQEPCKFLMSNSCLKGDDCSYSHDLRAFPCKFFHTRGLCYDGENCQFSHGAISEDSLAKLKQRVEKEKKERISSISALDIPTPSFSTHLPPELDPDPLGWGTSSLHPSPEEQMQYTNTSILDQSTRLYGDVNINNHDSVPPATGMMPGQSIGFSTSTDSRDTEFDVVSPLQIGEEADEYKYIQFSNTKGLQLENLTGLRKVKSEGESSVPMGLASTEGPYPSTMPKLLKAPVCPFSPDERSDAREVLEVPQMEGKMDRARSLREEPLPRSSESDPQDDIFGHPSLLSPLFARTVVPMLRGRQLGSLVLEHEKVLQSPQQTGPKRHHTVDSLLDEALRH